VTPRYRGSNAAVVLAAAALDVAFSNIGELVTDPTPRSLGWVAVILTYTGGGAVILSLRRRHPGAVFAGLWVHAMLGWGVSLLTPEVHYGPFVGVLVALFGVALRGDLLGSVGALAGALVTLACEVAYNVVYEPGPDRTATLVVNVVVYLTLGVAVWGAGRWGHRNVERARELEIRWERAAHEAVTTERGRIARELHDIVAHSVTVMVLQAAGAQRVVDADPDRARESLAHIEDVGKQAMGELRRLLAVLRASGPDATTGLADGGQPGLEDIDRLLDTVRSAGVPARLEVTGQSQRVDPSVGLAAYRVVQEALTNVTKHSGPGASAAVALCWTDRALTINVTDDGRGTSGQRGAALSTGHGLVGLRERVNLLGGHLVTGPASGGGYTVTATLPYTPRDSHDGPRRGQVGDGGGHDDPGAHRGRPESGARGHADVA
jgi:signal transduction histidine kinase